MSNIGSGNRGRFSDRLKRMRYNKLYRKKKMELEDSEIMYKNFLKVIAVIPLMVAGNILDNPENNNQVKIVGGKRVYVYKKNINPDIKKDKIMSLDEENLVQSNNQKHDVQAQITSYAVDNSLNDEIEHTEQNMEAPILNSEKGSLSITDVDNKGEKQEKTVEQSVIGLPEEANESIDEIETVKTEENEQIGIDLEEEKDNSKGNIKSEENVKIRENENPAKLLEKKITNLIKKELIKMINNLEIYESELYILSEINNDEKTLEECRKNIAEVKKLLAKIDALKRKYDHLKDNYDFEYLLENYDGEVIDKITELRDMFGKDEVKVAAVDYKLLEAYKYLYTKVDEIKINASKIEEEKQKQEEELKERDIDFEKLKGKVCDINKINDSYAYFVSQQNQFLDELSKKVSNIDSHEVINYRIKGFGRYMASSFKYLGLLMLTPLRGVFPSIAAQTVVAHNMARNMRQQIQLEKKEKMVYDATDDENSINYAIDDLNYTGQMLDDTLANLAKLKMEYNDRFRQYQGDFSEYYDVITKISSMQEAMINNKIKIEIMKNRAKTYLVENDSKMKLVKKLNYDEEKKDD